jgi:hypothetical protein
MNSATIAMNSQAIVTPTALSWKFIRWARDAGVSIAVYAVGVCYSFAGIRRASAHLR